MEPEPLHVGSWGTGAVGERIVGEVLDNIEGTVALHDRKAPGGRSNIDHIVVTPAGVWVVDTKRFPDAHVELHVEGLFRQDTRLLINKRDQTRLADRMSWQVDQVSKLTQRVRPDTTVRAALCFVDATWPLFQKRPFLVHEVAICWPTSMQEFLTRPGPLDPETIEATARLLARAFPSA